MGFNTGINEIVVNKPSYYPISATDGAGTAVTPTSDAAKFSIQKWLDIYTDESIISDIRAYRSVPIAKKVETIDTSELTLTNPSSGTETAVFRIKVEPDNKRAEFAQMRQEYGESLPFHVRIGASTTEGEVLAQLYTLKKSAEKLARGKKPEIAVGIPDSATVSGTYTTGTTFSGVAQSALTDPVEEYTSISEVSFTGIDETIDWKIAVTDDQLYESDVLSYTKGTDTEPDVGVGSAKFINDNIRLRTENSVEPYALLDGHQLAEDGAVYTTILFEVETSRSDESLSLGQSDGTNNRRKTHEMFIKETSDTLNDADGSYIHDVLEYLLKNAPSLKGSELKDENRADVQDTTNGSTVTETPLDIDELITNFLT